MTTLDAEYVQKKMIHKERSLVMIMKNDIYGSHDIHTQNYHYKLAYFILCHFLILRLLRKESDRE